MKQNQLLKKAHFEARSRIRYWREGDASLELDGVLNFPDQDVMVRSR